MEKQQVQRKISSSDLNRELGSNKAKVASQLNEKGFELKQQSTVKVSA